MEKTTLILENYDFNRAVFLNEIKNNILSKSGRLADEYGLDRKPYLIIKAKDSQQEYVTHYTSYISYVLDGYYSNVQLNDNFYMRHIYTKAPIQKGDYVYDTYADDTELPEKYIRSLIEDPMTIEELKELAETFVEEFKQCRDTKVVKNKKEIEVPNTYNHGTHMETIYKEVEFRLQEVNLL